MCVSLSATVTLTEVFLIDFGQQWSVMGQRKKIWQQYMLFDQVIVDFSIFKKCVDNKKKKIQTIVRLSLLNGYST